MDSIHVCPHSFLHLFPPLRSEVLPQIELIYWIALIILDFGQSYASKTLSTATDFYHAEIECVNTAAKVARSSGAKGDWVLSVGATPTAHAATTIDEKSLQLEGELEL